MKPIPRDPVPRCRPGLLVLSFLLGTSSFLAAQYENKSGVYNRLSQRVPAGNPSHIPPIGVATAPIGDPTITPQYSNVVESSAGTGMVLPTPTSAASAAYYPTNVKSGAGVMLQHASFGTAFASGVPRFSYGDRISPPTSIISAAGALTTISDPASYWRAEPVRPGEVLTNPGGGATIDYRTGDSAVVPALATGVMTAYYYSPHAKVVFANTPGQVEITWRSSIPDPATNNYVFYKERFTVSSATTSPVRTMFWTEKSFNGPRVTIPSGRIVTVNPVYSNVFPATVATEYVVAGTSGADPNAEATQVLRTLWYEKSNGVGELHAYNLTGRILVEYLGTLREDGTHEFLGADIVSVEQAAQPTTLTVQLGNQITHGTTETLTALPVTTTGAANQVFYYGSNPLPDGTLAYYAERENDIEDRVVFYWLEKQDAAIPMTTGSAPGLAIDWPKYLNKYLLVWPSNITDYASSTVPTGGSSVENGTGLQFQDGKIPQIIYQDSLTGSEAFIDTVSQRYIVSLGSGGDQTNRTLLKFVGSNGGVWYVRLVTQADGRSGYQEGDGGTALTGSVYVGDRINPPSSDYSVAGYVSAGRSYSSAAYIDPFAGGVAAAEKGAIIPVNALPSSENALSVWWFKKVKAPSSEFADFYTPAKIGRYSVAYRTSNQVANENFNTNASGWSKSTITPMGGGSFFGPYSVGDVVSKSFPITGDASQGVNLAFTFHRMDTWDSEKFQISLNGFRIIDAVFGMTQVTTALNGSVAFNGINYTWSVTPIAGSFVNFYGSTASWTDQSFRVAIQAKATGTAALNSLDLSITSTLNEAISNESFGIDDLTLDLPLPDQIIMASNLGTGSLSSAVSAGSVYNQPDPTKAGYNPNEEHALIVNGRGYALRDDLNLTAGVVTGSTFTSLPRALIQYTDPTDQRPSIAVYEVLRESPAHPFSYPITAGTIISSPMPLPLMPLPVDSGGHVKNAEVPIYTDAPPAAGAPASYAPFTFKDRKGYDWVYRGPHVNDTSRSLGMKFYYVMRGDFYFPNMTQPALGTILPYLRTPNGSGGYTGDAVSGDSLAISYFPAWPASPPVMSVGETLALPARGLPAVRGQTSARVLYQQSIANSAASSVTLHDPTRAKSVLINNATVGLTALPGSLKTTNQNGKTYFQLAQPHLQQRFYFDPTLGDIGGLVLTGEFHDEIAGEDYLDLNALSDADVAALISLVDPLDKDVGRWTAAITALTTAVETFKENPSAKGTYIVDSTKTVNVTAQALAELSSSDTAVDSYALTALGKGEGYVTLVFGDGAAFTPQGEPVAMQVIKVQPKLYQGDLKMIAASNPLDEQTSLRHSSDFAAKPGDYEFEWRYSPPVDGMAPQTYSYDFASYLKGGLWYQVDNPKSTPDVAVTYPGTATSLTAPVVINSAAYDRGLGFPGRVMKSATNLDFTAGVPTQVIFSADMPSTDGFVLYVNHVPVLAYEMPSGMGVPGGLTPQAPRVGLAPKGLKYQFDVPATAFIEGANVIEVALYSTLAAGTTTSTINFQFDAPQANDHVVAADSAWFLPSGTFSNTIVIGGSAASPLGDPLLVFSDTYFTMRYRAKSSANLVTGTKWSEWMQPVLVESWVKRVLDGINPFNQRQTDLYNNPVSTDVSILTQAGKRWEGDVALNLKNINDFGLIEIYETVLNRVKKQSLDGEISTESVNSTLLLVAGYLSDLYMTLGDEAWDDAQNPTILIDGDAESSDISSARFSFEGQMATMMDETLGLLRGRDDFLSPGTRTTPSYNRLYWNYTNGISSGEPIYAVNYDIKEKAGGPYADGVLDASDAYYMFPQGHGDAYGHYLTALTGYYKLLTASAFDWKPSTEGVTVLGQTVQVDYKDERKFAAAAAAVARTGEEIIDFTARANHQEGEEHGWVNKHDGTDKVFGKYNSSTGRTRYWGTDEWCSRVSQGAYYNWVSANAMLPDIDKDHEGIQKIDRTTVPELNELVSTAEKVLSLSAGEQAHLNPLGLAADAMTFDISPALLATGKSHFEQIYDRAVKAAVNAKNAFQQAGKMNRLLRSQNNSLDDYNEAINRQEAAYEYQLTTLFGTAYAGDVGPGKLYEQGYTGPDLYHSYFIDRPSSLVDTSADLTVTFKEPVNHDPFKEWSVDNVYNKFNDPVQYTSRTYRVSPFTLGQFSDTVTAGLGKRGQPGRIQAALLDAYEAQVNLRDSSAKFTTLMKRFDRDYQLYSEFLADYDAANAASGEKSARAAAMAKASLALSSTGAALSLNGEYLIGLADASSEGPPTAVGLANDATSIARMIAKLTGRTGGYAQQLLGLAADTSAAVLDAQAADLDGEAQAYIDDYNFDSVKKQHVVEFEKLYDDVLATGYDITRRLTELQRATEKVSAIYAEANHILSDRETFRQRAASVIQGYRTRDVVYRDFRNEELAQYKGLFDLAQTYAHCAAMAYDYETGLLNSELGEDFISDIIGTYSIGDWSGENPVESGSGDSGLASILSNLRDEWEIVEGRLGINNPDRNGTVFSLRQELFRIRTDQPTADDDLLWKQVLQQHMMSNVLNDPDVAIHCSNIAKTNGGAVPGIVLSFGTTIEQGLNFFGWPLAAGDHTFSQSTFATKIYSSGLVFKGYVGMDPYSIGTPGAGGPASSAANALSATPYAYLIPAGNDTMRAPPLGDANIIRSWAIKDQALPLPKNLGANSFSSSEFFTPQGSLNEQLWITRKHQAFRAVDDQAYFYSSMPAEFTNSRLVGRSAWNTQWKIVIPAYSLLSDEQTGLDRFAQSVSDIKLFLRTYSNSGN